MICRKCSLDLSSDRFSKGRSICKRCSYLKRKLSPLHKLRKARSRHQQKPKYNISRRCCYAVRRGLLTRGSCVICGTFSEIQGHHNDYSKPLDVVWLCSEHHIWFHKVINKFKNQPVWVG